MSAHETRVDGDHKTGWQWTCTCGRQGAVIGETGSPRRGAQEHLRRMRRKEQS